MEADGPDPAPTGELKAVFAERHAEKCSRLRERLMLERLAA
jgi:hypothetical protein